MDSHGLTRQDPFQWTPNCQETFEQLKNLLVTSPVIDYPDFQRPFGLHTNVSGAGLRAAVEQVAEDGQLHLIAYVSQTHSKHERNSDRHGGIGSDMDTAPLQGILAGPSLHSMH